MVSSLLCEKALQGAIQSAVAGSIGALVANATDAKEGVNWDSELKGLVPFS